MKHVPQRNFRRPAPAQPLARVRRPRPLGVSLARYASIAAVCGALVAGATAPAAVVYLDNNGSLPGSGIVGGSSILWNASTPIWNDLSGTGTALSWLANDTAIFAAGMDAGNPFTVTVDGPQAIGGLTFQVGGITLTSGASPNSSLVMSGNATFDVSANLTATVNTVLAGTSDLTKTGAGTLILGGANTYAGRTFIGAGTLSISSDGNLGATSAVPVADSISFTGSSTLQFTGAGNQTLNANRSITIGNTFTGTLQVVSAASTLTYVGSITGNAGTTFRKTGAGTLEFQGGSSLAGALNIDGGTLKLSGSGALASTSGVLIGNRATLTLDDSATNLGGRTAGTLTSAGGTINLLGNAAGTVETLGALTLNPGALTINSTAVATGNLLMIPSLTRGVVGGTLFLNGNGLGGANNQLILSTAPALVNSILKYAVVSDGTLTSFANYTTSGGTNQSVIPLALAAHNPGAETSWLATSNVRPTADVPAATGAARSLYTLTLDSGIDILAPLTSDRTLNLSGAVLQTGGVSIIAQSGAALDNVLAWGTNEAIFHILGSLQLDRGNTNSLTGTGGFTKSGAGTLILNGVSTLTAAAGTFNANEGVLELRGATSLMTAAAALNLNGANLRLTQLAGTTGGVTYIGNPVVNADTTVTISRVDNPATVTAHTLGATLSIGGGRTLSANSLNLTAGTAYGLTMGATTITSGGAIFDVSNNGAGVGTITLGAVTSGGNTITKTGTGDLVTNTATGSFGGGVVDIQVGRAGFSNASGTVTDATTFMGPGGLFKSGAGAATVTGGSTFTGGVTVTAGTLGFSTVSDNGGPASSLGQGADGITVGAATLSFAGATNQTTNRKLTLTGGVPTTAAAGAGSTLNAGGTGGTVITFAGGFDGNSNSLYLTGNATSSGAITAGVTQTGTTADLIVFSGTWALSGTPIVVADDILAIGSTAVLNLNTAGILTYTTGGSNGLYARTGAIINLGVNDVTGVAAIGGNDLIVLGDSGTGTLNVGAFNVTTPTLTIGDDDNLTDTGLVVGSGGAVTATAAFTLYRGSIAANLAGAGTITKTGLGDVTLSGDNSGLTTAAGAVALEQGNLILDYTASNAAKLNATNSVTMNGATLTINGSASFDTSQDVLFLTLTNSAPNTITVNSGAGHSATLNLNNLTRTAGTVRFNLPVSGAITTTKANTGGILGGWATATDSLGVTNFAANDGLGKIIGITPTARDNPSLWAANENLTDSAGFSGTLGSILGINTLRFNAAGSSTVTIGDGQALGVNSGGILQTNVVTGPSLITGGRLVSGAGSELIFTLDSAQLFTVASAITGGAAVSKSGNGTLKLTGTNNYNGATKILAGTLQVAGGNAIGDTSAMAFSADRDSALELLDSEAIGSVSGGGNSTLTALTELRLNTNTLTVNQAASGTYAGNILGSAGSSLVKTGAGNLQFSTGANAGFAGTVTVNQGLFYLSVSSTLPSVTAFTLNRGAFLIDGNGTTTTAARIADTTPFILNSADGNWSGETRPSGLGVRRDQGTAYSETVGVLMLNSGASYTRLDGTVTSAVAAIITDNITRSNAATIAVRGTNLSATSGARGQLRIGTAGNQTAFLTAMVGGGSTTLGTKNISIVPWAISEEYAAGQGDANMGNSLATYVSGSGFRALNLGTEYSTFATKASSQDNIRETLAASLTGLAGQAINGLVLNASGTAANAISVSGTGAGQTLAVTSGTMLFTATTAVSGSVAMGITLDGFDSGITVGGTNEYVIFVQNPSSVAATGVVTATINSPLASTADLTKSGRGTLVLTGVNLNAGGGAKKTTINEGVLQIADLDNIGGNTGPLIFAGGTLKLGVGASPTFTDDLSTRTIALLQGGGTIDTNGLDATATLGGGTGNFTKSGAGNLTLGGTSTYVGNTTVAGGTLTLGTPQAISAGALTVSGGATLAVGANNVTVASLTLSNAANVLSGTGVLTVNGDATVNRGSIAPQLAGSMNLLKLTAAQTVTLGNSANTYTGYTHVQDGALSVATLGNVGQPSPLGAPTGENAQIRLGNITTTGTLAYTGDTGSTDRMIVLPGTTGGGTVDNDGIGALTLAGNITGTDYGAKALTLQGAPTGFTNVVSGIISDGLGTVAVTKAEAGIWSLTSANTFTGGVNVNAGTLVAGHNQALGLGTLNFNGGTLQGDGTARTLANPVLVSANSTIGGVSDLTFTGGLTQTGADRTLTVNNTGVTNFNGAFALDRGATNGILTISPGTGVTVNIANLQDGAGTGTGSLTKTGAGALNITNAFNLSGTLLANGGVTTLTAASATMANLQVGRNGVGALNYNVAGGSLNVGSGSANVVEIGASTGTVSSGTLDLTGLDNFTANVGFFRVGSFSTSGGNTTSASATLATNNIITAATEFNVNDNLNGGTGLGGPVALVFGGGTNTLTTPKITIGNGKSAGTAPFANVSIAAGGTLTINNGAGLPTDLSIGTEKVNTGTLATNNFDLTGGTLIATLDDIILAERASGGAGTTTATFTIGSSASNAITANTLSIASVNTGTASTGTLNFGGGTFNLVGDVALATFTTSGAVRGTLNITGGAFTVGGNITKTASATGVVIVDGAGTTLDMTSGTIASTQFAFRNGSITNLAVGGVTLDAVSGTTGTGNTGDALILSRDVTLSSAVTLTGATGGAIHYENNGGSTGATIVGALDMGVVGRTFNVEDSPTAAIDLTLNGNLLGTAGFTKIGVGALRLFGATAQTYTGTTAIQDGRLILGGGADNRIAATNPVILGAGATSAVLQLGGATGKSDLTLNSLAFSGTGTANAVVGGAATPSTLALTIATDTTYTASFGGTGLNESNLSLVKNGAAVLNLPGANNLSGAVTVNGGTLNLTGPNNLTSATVNNGGILSLIGNSSIGGAITVNGGTLSGRFGATGTTISVGAGSALNFTDASAVSRTLSNSPNVLILGAGSKLGFEVGSATAPFVDQILGGATSTAMVTGLVNIDLFSLGNLSANTYTLISMPGGGLLNTNGSTGSYVINSAPGGFQFSLSPTDTLLKLVITSVNVPIMYWRNGLGDNSWSSLSGGNTNWTTDPAGTVNAQATPAGATDVIFSATNAPLTGGAISTTLDGSFSVKTLSFTSNPTGVTSVAIIAGIPAGSALTITPASAATGLDVADNAGAISIAPAIALGADQTWSVAGTGANGSSLTVSGNLSGSGSLTKTGAGSAILSGTNSYGATAISAGTLQIGNGGTTGTLGSGAVTNNGSLVFNHGAGANISVPNVISGTGSLTKTGAGTVTLSGVNTYSGKTAVTGGVLKISSEENLGGNPAALTADQLTLSGGGTLQTSATVAIDDANRGLTLGTGGGVLATDSGTTATVSSVITGSGSLTKLGTGTLVLGSSNSYTGGTVIDGGTVKTNVAQVLTGGLTFGVANTSTNVGTLDLNGTNASFSGGLTVQSNTATANTIIVGAGQTLSIGGSVNIGVVPAVANANARLTINGGGSLSVVTPAAGLFQVGGATGGTSQASTLDLTNLTSATINVSATGTVRVSQPTVTNVLGNLSTLLLPTPTTGILPTTPVTTITAANLNVGDSSGNQGGAGQTNVVTLGTGLTILNVNTVNIGTGARDFGQLTFAPGNGTLRLRAANGTSRAAFNLASGGANTGVAGGTGVTNNVNFTGHNVDLFITTLTIGAQNRNSARTDTFTFDTGTLDATGVVVGSTSGTAQATVVNSTWTSTLNLAGGTTTIGTSGLAIGTGANAVTGTDVIVAAVNISGGAVTVADNATFGAAIRLGQNTVATTLTVNGSLNVTGTGSLTVAGNILRGATTGPGSATVTLDGGTLDMGGKSIGNATMGVTFNALQGTLKNLGELNGGNGLTKSGPDTLVVTGTNTYTGGTNLSAGTLQVGNGGADGTLGSDPVTTAANTTLAIKRSDTFTLANTVNGAGNLAQIGSGTTILASNHGYSGTTTISSGTLQVGNGGPVGSLGTGAVINNANLNFQRSDSAVVTSTIGGNGTITQSGALLTLNGAVTGQALHAASGQVNLGTGDSTPANPNHSLTALTVDSGSTVQFMTRGLKLLQATSLSLAGTAVLDLTSNALVLDYAGGVENLAQTAAVATLLKAGFNGGLWNGLGGINTSKVTDDRAANPTNYQYLTGIGYMSGALTSGSFLGRSVDAGSVVARYTYYGDANLDGVVNSQDYALIDSGFAAQGTPGFVYSWTNGDFNYDGHIDGADYALIDTVAAFTNGAPMAPASFTATLDAGIAAPQQDAALPASAPMAALGSMPEAVPEPASFGLLALGGALLGFGRRRKVRTN